MLVEIYISMKLFSPFRCVALVKFIPHGQQSLVGRGQRGEAEEGGGGGRREEGRGGSFSRPSVSH